MATVLFGWELGGGLGHIVPLVRIAEALAHDGHQPVFVVKDLSIATKHLSEHHPDHDWPVLQPPLWPKVASRDAFVATGYADVLGRIGYLDETLLATSLSAWLDLIREIEPALVVTNYAPTLNLAAWETASQVIIGTGFTVPPAHKPTFVTYRGTSSPSQVNQDEMLACVQNAREQLCLSPLSCLTDFQSAPQSFALTLRALDPHRGSRVIPAIGLMDDPVELSTKPDDSKFYAYLDGRDSAAVELLAALARAGIAGNVHLKFASPEQEQRLMQLGLQMEPNPINFRERMNEFALVIHHGGNATAASALLAGRPQVLLPRFLEQDLTGDALAELGVGVSLKGTLHVADLIATVQSLMSDTDRISHMHSVASQIRQRESFDALKRIVDHCRGELS